MSARLNFNNTTLEDNIEVYKDFGGGFFDMRPITVEWTVEILGITREGYTPPPIPGGWMPLANIQFCNVNGPFVMGQYPGRATDYGTVFGGITEIAWSSPLKHSTITGYMGANTLWSDFRKALDEGDYVDVLDHLPKTYMRFVIDDSNTVVSAYSDSSRTEIIHSFLPATLDISGPDYGGGPFPLTAWKYFYPFFTIGNTFIGSTGMCTYSGYIEDMTIDVGSGPEAVDFDEYTITGDTEGKVTRTGGGGSVPVTGDPVLDALLNVQEDQDGQLVWSSTTCDPCSRANYVQYQRELIDSLVADGTYTAAEGRALKLSARTTRGSNGKVINHP